MIHELKILPEYFEDILSGEKTFEIRKNDRTYNKGDMLALNEYTQDGYTGRCMLVQITYILTGTTFLPEGFCCISFRPCCIEDGKAVAWRVPVYGGKEDRDDG